MTTTVCCYTQIVTSADGEREASMIFPQIEVSMALYRYNAMCKNIDGAGTEFEGDETPHGFVTNIIEEYGGWLAMVNMTMTDAGWNAVKAAVANTSNPVVWGWTPDEFVDNVRSRRNAMYNNLKVWRPNIAKRLDSLSDIRWLLDRIPVDDVVTTRLRDWMLSKIDLGQAAPPLPVGLYDPKTMVNFDVARQVWNRWQAESEGTDYKMMMRLWEFYCLNLIVLNSRYGTA